MCVCLEVGGCVCVCAWRRVSECVGVTVEVEMEHSCRKSKQSCCNAITVYVCMPGGGWVCMCLCLEKGERMCGCDCGGRDGAQLQEE